MLKNIDVVNKKRDDKKDGNSERAETSSSSKKKSSSDKTKVKGDVFSRLSSIHLSDIKLPPEPAPRIKHKEKKHRDRKEKRDKKHSHKHSEKKNDKLKSSGATKSKNGNINNSSDDYLLTIETGESFMNKNIDFSKTNINFDSQKLLENDNDEYEKRFSDVKRYIPFLEMMIDRHRQMNDHKSLKKMESLHEVLTQSKKKLKMETLRRCEDVLEKLYHKVGESLRKETSAETLMDYNSSSLKKTRFHQIGNLDASYDDGGMSPMSSPSTSPTPPYSPDDNCLVIDDDNDIDNDIIIKRLEKQAHSPEEGEIVDGSDSNDENSNDTPALTITLDNSPEKRTRRDSDMSIDDDDGNNESWKAFVDKHTLQKPTSPKWKPVNPSRQPIVVTGHDVSTAAQIVGNNISKKGVTQRAITPPPKKLDESELNQVFNEDSFDSDRLNIPLSPDSNSRLDSPLNVPEEGLRSPDPELFMDKSNSPLRIAEPPPVPVPPPEPIVNPPRVNDIPLISMADLEDLILNQSKILKEGLPIENKDDKEKEIPKSPEPVTPIRRKQTGNVKIAPMTLKLDAFISGGKERTPSPELLIDPRIRARMQKEKNVDPRLAKDKQQPPRTPAPTDMYSLHDFNVNPNSPSPPLPPPTAPPACTYPSATNSNQWNYNANSMPNQYGMPHESTSHNDSWERNQSNSTMSPNMNSPMNINSGMNMNSGMNINPNMNSGMNINPNMNSGMNMNPNMNMNPVMSPNMNMNSNPNIRGPNMNISPNSGYGNNIHPGNNSYQNYDYPQQQQQPPPQQQQYQENFGNNTMPYGHQNPPNWNRADDPMMNQRMPPARDLRDIRDINVHMDNNRPDWEWENRQNDWDRDRQNDWDRGGGGGQRMNEWERDRQNDWPRQQNDWDRGRQTDWDRQNDWPGDRQNDWDRQNDCNRQNDWDRQIDWDNRSRFKKNQRNRSEISQLKEIITRDPRLIAKDQEQEKEKEKEEDKGKEKVKEEDKEKEIDTAKDVEKDKDIEQDKEKEKDKEMDKEKEKKKEKEKQKVQEKEKIKEKEKVKEKDKLKEKIKERRSSDSRDGVKTSAQKSNLKGASKFDILKNKEKMKLKEGLHKLGLNKKKLSDKEKKISLESLYGVVDTKAAAGQKILQKFKIPKLKKPDSTISTDSKSDDQKNTPKIDDIKKKIDIKAKDRRERSLSKDKILRKDKPNKDNIEKEKNKEIKEKNKDMDKEKNNETVKGKKKTKKQEEIPENKDNTSHNSTVVVSDLKNFINIILTQDGGKEFLKKATLLDHFKDIFEEDKDLMTMKEMIQLDSDNSESENLDIKKKRKSLPKRRVIVSDSENSDDESLADRIEQLDTTKEEKKIDDSEETKKRTRKPRKKAVLVKVEEESKKSIEEIETEKELNEEVSKKSKEDKKEIIKRELPKRGVNKKEVEKEDISNENLSKEELTKKEETTNDSINDVSKEDNKEEDAKESIVPKARAKPRRKNSLERLQEDLKDYISSGIITAGQRTCRMAKETNSAVIVTSPSTSNTIDSSQSPDSKLKPGPKFTKKSPTKEGSNEDGHLSSKDENIKTTPIKKKKKLSGPKCKRSRVEMMEPTVLLRRADTSMLDEQRQDSSSDESNLDVSEMISTPGSPSDSKSADKLPRTRAARRKILSSNKEDETLTDTESLTSDISMSSSTTSKKPEVTKTGDDDTENLENSQIDIVVPKKVTRRKKRCGWRLGIVSKAKRRKARAQYVKPNLIIDADHLTDDFRRPSIEVITDHETRKRIHGPDEIKIKTEPDNDEDTISIADSQDSEIIIKHEIKSEEIEDIVKEEQGMEIDTNDSDISLSQDLILEAEMKINTKLVNYVSYGQEKIKCLHCRFNGKSIVHHYAIMHPEKEVSVSRLNPTDAKSVIQEAKEMNFENDDQENQNEFTFTCRFCPFKSEGRKEDCMESSYEHCTSHTGEYRFTCKLCSYMSITRTTMKIHHYKKYKPQGLALSETMVEKKVPNENRVYGYICSICKFVQLNKSNVVKHIQQWHKNDSNVDIIKINMSVDKIAEGRENTNLEKSKTINSDPIPETSQESEVDKETRKNNLSAFVCPPELENNKEIELERKKKMQEIVENIGIKVNNKEVKKGLSIIDKLKDKMETTVNSENDDSETRTVTKSPNSTITNITTVEDATLHCTEEFSNADILETRDDNETKENDENEDDDNEDDEVSKPKDPLDVENDTQDEVSDSEQPALRFDTESSSDNEEATTDVNDLLKETTDIKNQSNDSMMTTIQRLAAQIQGSKSTSPDTEVPPLVESSSPMKDIPKAPNVIPISALKKKPTLSSFFGNYQVNKIAMSSENKGDDSSLPKLFLRPRRISGDMLSVPETESTEPPVAGTSTQNADSESSSSNPGISTTDSDSFLKIENVVSLANPTEAGNDNTVVRDIIKAVESSHIKISPLSLLKKNGPIILKRVNKPPPLTHTLSNQTIKAVNPKSNETVKLIPINISSNSSTTPSNYLPIMSPSSFKTYMDGKKVSICNTTSTSILTKPGNLTTVSIAKPNTTSKPATITPVTIGSNLTPIKATTYAPITNPNFPIPICKTGTLTPIAPVSKATTIVSASTSSSSSSPSASSSPTQNRKIVKVVSNATLLKQNEFGPQVAVKLKNATAYNEMLKPEKLRHIYKCMGRDCAYTTDNPDHFRRHFERHAITCDISSNSMVPYDFKKCAYCYSALGNWYQMELHYEEKHAFCMYQCSYCFYRAISQSYVEIHQASAHPTKPLAVLQGATNCDLRPQADFNRNERVKPFVCQNDCNKYFYVPEAFFVHLKMKHSSISVFKCHLCKIVSYSPEQLILHYKTHGIFKYQCLHCTHGSDSITDIHSHLSGRHCNQKPVLLERTLPPQPTKLKSAIDQLLLRNPDEHYSLCSELITFINLPDESVDTDAKVKKGTDSIVQLNSAKADVSNYVISVSSPRPNSPPTIKIVATESLQKNVDKTAVNKILDVDPLRIGNNEDGDEFLSTNLLDDHDFLTNTSFSKKTTVNDDDSDIEIIEDCGVPQNNEKQKNKESEITIKDLLNSADNSDLSNDSLGPSKNDKFLALDDIKHTGLAGEELYKCGAINCKYSAPNSKTLRNHIKECCVMNVPYSCNNSINFQCMHCDKTFQKIGFFMEHLEIHGLKRFACGICGERYAMQNQAQTHMKMKHKFASRLLPADPKNPTADGLFYVQPMIKTKKKLSKLTEKEIPKMIDPEKTCFSPNEIDLLPRQAIYQREVQCAVCPFSTKVRSNIFRHLQLHAKDETVPESGPVNPVPCLDKREKMFDKMVNLASSSHQNGRMGIKTKETVIPNDEETLPKYVPENKRYVCGISECSYLTVNEDMLRYHLKALHSDEPFFKCTHCKEQELESQNISFEKMGIHLKMHDSKLYKCSYCNYFHYQRHVVERHLGDKHSDKRPFVKVVREFETNENNQSPPEENEEDTPDSDGNHWKCNCCDFRCVYKSDMHAHAANEHEEKCQFKCTVCPYKTNARILLDQHLISKHANEPEADFQMIYQKIKGLKKVIEQTEQGTSEEPFDTTPLWRRDMPRVKHIRGILIEEDPASMISSSPVTPEKSAKRKNDSFDSPTKSAKIKCFKPVTFDEINEEIGKYGPYGNPEKDSYVCTICKNGREFRTRYKHDMRDHLYRELRYVRWHCISCGFVSVNKTSLTRHCTKSHEGQVPNFESLPLNQDYEDWVSTLLKRQTEKIKKYLDSLSGNSNESGKSKSPIKQPQSSSLINLDSEDDVSDDENPSDDETPAAVEDGDKAGFSLVCKHCHQKFPSKRGFKMHVTKQHLKKYKFICTYCDRSSNLESIIEQHIRAKHAGRYVKVIPNTFANDVEINDEFWEREYGVPPGKERRGQKRKANFDESSGSDKSKEVTSFVCRICHFVALTLAGYISHKKSHKMIYKCAYCSYHAVVKNDVRKHSKTEHPHLTANIEEIAVSNDNSSTSKTDTTQIVENPIVQASKIKKFVYWCEYCNVRCKSLFSMKKHWTRLHKDPKPHENNKWKVGPFKFTIEEEQPPQKKESIPGLTSTNTTATSNETWVCGWCNDYSNGKENMELHHRNFHSHLTIKCSLVDPLEVSKEFKCPECEFKTKTHDLMLKHVGRHIKKFQCKYCDKNFTESFQATQHCLSMHPENEPKVEGRKNYDALIQEMMQLAESGISRSNKNNSDYVGIAKKSTAKPVVRVRPFSKKFKSVARKSTTPLPRYPFGIKYQIEAISHYGIKTDPIDLATVNTYMVVGGHRMKVNCTTLSQFMNINPKLVIEDIKRGLK